MKHYLITGLIVFLSFAYACATSPDNGQSGGVAAADPAQNPKPGPLNFPTYTTEKEKEIRALAAKEWVPVKIDRHYLILRGPGIRVEQGDYFVQLLADSTSKITKFLLAKKRGVKLAEIDLNKARARDGSFAAVLDFAAEVDGPQPYAETRAYCSSSGESAAVWVHLAGSKTEWRGELMALAGPSAKPQTHQ